MQTREHLGDLERESPLPKARHKTYDDAITLHILNKPHNYYATKVLSFKYQDCLELRIAYLAAAHCVPLCVRPLKLLQQTHKFRQIIDAFKKRRAKNFGTRDHLNQRIEWYLQMC